MMSPVRAEPHKTNMVACALIALSLTLCGSATAQVAEVANPNLTTTGVDAIQTPKPSVKPNTGPLVEAFAQHRAQRRKLGQLLFLGFRGKNSNSKFVRTFTDQIEQGHVGGVLFLGQNISRSREDLVGLVSSFTKAHAVFNRDVPLLLGIDQEGGKVARLKQWHGVTQVAAAEDVAVMGAARATETYKRLACEVRKIGFNVNFGPVVDVNINRNSPVIGGLGRSYSGDPSEVIDLAGAFLDGHDACQMGAVAKHFPGHGSATVDSHKGLPNITRVWRPSEMLPYRELIASNRVPAVMTGHLFHNLIDGEEPASLSKAWVTDYLRGRLGFNGLVLTDDLDMDAISDANGPIEAVIKALAAGNDMALIGGGTAPYPDLAREILDAMIGELARPDARLNWDQVEVSRTRIAAFANPLR